MSAVIVWRERIEREYLVLRTAGAADSDDWAWRPPSGTIEPGETPQECASRELLEETGLALSVEAVSGVEYPTFVAEVGADCEIVLSDEHDLYEWVFAAELVRRCRPAVVSANLAHALDVIGHD